MKKNLLFLFTLICSMGLFTACSDDDDVKYPIDTEIAGTYKGTLDVTLDKLNIGTGIPKNVYIANAGNSSINMELKDFTFMGIDLGTILISNCAVTQSGTTYAFTGTQTLTSLPEAIGQCPVTVNGTVADGKTTINLDITVTKLGQTVKVVYEGTRLLGGESSEAKISGFAIDSEVVTEQPVIDEAAGTITFKVNAEATDEQLKLTPVLIVSEKATVSPATGVAQDFSKGKKVAYTVVAADGTVKVYTASIAGSQNVLKFSFEDWENVPGSDYTHEYDKPIPTDILASSAEGASMLKMYGTNGMPVYKTTDKKEGIYAIKLVTLDTSEQANSLVPAITPGSVFTGKFDLAYLDWETGGKLDCTRFGVPYAKKPLRFKGSYKYAPGAKFLDGSKYPEIIEVAKTDECSVVAVLYEVAADDEVLTGNDINKSDKRVAVAALADGTAKENYTDFDIEFTYLPGKSYVAGTKYKLAIVCSSSKEGDFFMGAGGSTLILDELEVIGE